MTKDEMKNKISMALKDPILQQGFEIICKENTELKEENKVLAQNLEDTEILNKAYEKRFDDLKKENAELKEDSSEWEKASDKWKSVYELTNKQLEMSNKVYNDNLDYSHHIEEQLTNAKEIISELLRHYNAKTIYIANMQPTLDKAEQFLNREVEDKENV